MKKTSLYAIISILVISFGLASCLGDDTVQYDITSDAVISSFSIEDIVTEIASITSEGSDTTYLDTVTGDDYPFTIDQQLNRIYNKDSLPYGTDVTKVLTSLTMSYGYTVTYVKSDGNDTLWTSTDSIDFSSPVIFRAYALDGTVRNYRVTLNVHQQDPDSLQWTEMNVSGFDLYTPYHKAVYYDGMMWIYYLDEDDGTLQVMTSADGTMWESQPVTNVGLEPDYTSLIVGNDALYMLFESKVYTSVDGLNWTAVDSDVSFSSLVAYSPLLEELYAVSLDGSAIYTYDGTDWVETDETDSNFPVQNMSYATYRLTSNPGIERLTLVGLTAGKDSVAVVWSKLSNATNWEFVDRTHQLNIGYFCPRLEKLATVYFGEHLIYAFGGASIYNNLEIASFQSIYVSGDDGMSWKEQTEKVMFPVISGQEGVYNPAREFTDRPAEFSYLVDDENYLWLFWNSNNVVTTPEVWRGRINRLGFDD